MALIKRENIAVAFEKYTDKFNQEKTSWRTIGEVLTFSKDDGSVNKMVKIYSMPGASISLFEQKPKDQANVPVSRQPMKAPNIPVVEGKEINVKDIPF